MTDIRENKPWSVSQIKTEKPNIDKTFTLLSGFTGGSFNAAHNKTIHVRQVMAGQRIKQAWWEGSIKLLTPKTVSYQNLICTARSYFVPNDRVWKNYLKFATYKGGSTEDKISEIPNLAGKEIPWINNSDNTFATSLDNTAFWRDTMISSYIPRTSVDEEWDTEESEEENMVKTEVAPMSVLGLRGRIAIYNDYERNKMYDPPLEEFTESDVVTDREWQSYLPTSKENYLKLKMRAKANDSYYTNYRTEIQGIESDEPTINENNSLINWTNWENLTDFARQTVNDSELNDWQILARMRGSKEALEGKVQLIGKHSFVLNYNSITQSTYNTNSSINQEYRVMGAQGGYSYTYVKIPLYAGQEFTQDGYIHTIFTVTADTVYTNAYPRQELNISIYDRYRPELKDQKQDVLYKSECGVVWNMDGNNNIDSNWGDIYGFKRKFSEYFKLENNVNGDVCNEYVRDYTGRDIGQGIYNYAIDTKIQPQNTYTFFEYAKNLANIRYNNYDVDANYLYEKDPWLDYSDLQVNKNQAVPNDTGYFEQTINGVYRQDFYVAGNNQFVYIGKVISEDDIPIDESIKNDFTEYGEH